MTNKLMAVLVAVSFSSAVYADSSKDEFQHACESKLMSSMATQLMYMKRNAPDQYQKAKSEVQQLFEEQCGCATENVDEFLTISGYQTHQEDFRALKWAWTSSKRRHLNTRQQDALGASASCFM